MIRWYVGPIRSFAAATTRSGRTYATMIPRWREQGYQVSPILLNLPGPEIAIVMNMAAGPGRQPQQSRGRNAPPRDPFFIGVEIAFHNAGNKRAVARNGYAVTWRDAKIVYDTQP